MAGMFAPKMPNTPPPQVLSLPEPTKVKAPTNPGQTAGPVRASRSRLRSTKGTRQFSLPQLGGSFLGGGKLG